MSDANLEPFVLRCDGSLTLASAVHCRERLLQAIDRNRSVVVDVSGAEDADVTFVQLLVSAHKSATAMGKTFSIGAGEGDATLAKLMSASVAAAEFPQRIDVPRAAASTTREHAVAATADEVDPTAIATLINEIGAPAVSQSLGVFFFEMSSRVRALKALSPKTELPAVLREAHLLKGTAGTFGLRKLSDDVAAFEATAGTLDADAYLAAVERMSGILERAQVAIEATMAKSAA